MYRAAHLDYWGPLELRSSMRKRCGVAMGASAFAEHVTELRAASTHLVVVRDTVHAVDGVRPGQRSPGCLQARSTVIPEDQSISPGRAIGVEHHLCRRLAAGQGPCSEVD